MNGRQHCTNGRQVFRNGTSVVELWLWLARFRISRCVSKQKWLCREFFFANRRIDHDGRRFVSNIHEVCRCLIGVEDACRAKDTWSSSRDVNAAQLGEGSVVLFGGRG